MYTGACGFSQILLDLFLIQFYVAWVSKLRDIMSILNRLVL